MNRKVRKRGFRNRGCSWWLALQFLCCGVAATAGAQPTAADATDEQKSEARRTYDEGKEAFVAGDYETALSHFEASLGNVASPNSRLMKARSLYMLGRGPEALLELRRTIREAEHLEDERFRQSAELAQQEAAELEKRLAWVHVTVEVGAESQDAEAAVLTVGGLQIDREQWSQPIPAEPGRIEVVLTDPAGRTVKREFDLKAGASASVTVNMGAPEKEASADTAPTPQPVAVETPVEVDSEGMDLRALGYVAGGVGVAGLTAFAVLGTMSNGKFADLEDACPSRTQCDPQLRDDADTGKTLQTAANVALVIGAVGIAAGVTLFVLGSIDEKSDVALGPGSILLRGEL